MTKAQPPRQLPETPLPATEKEAELKVMRLGSGDFATAVAQVAELIARGELDPSHPWPVALVVRQVKALAIRLNAEPPRSGIRSVRTIEERRRLGYEIVNDETLAPMLIPEAAETLRVVACMDPLAAVERLADELTTQWRYRLFSPLVNRGLIDERQARMHALISALGPSDDVRSVRSGGRPPRRKGVNPHPARRERLAELKARCLEAAEPWKFLLDYGADRQLVAEHRKLWSSTEHELSEHEARADWRIVRRELYFKGQLGQLTPLAQALESNDEERIRDERLRLRKALKRSHLQGL